MLIEESPLTVAGAAAALEEYLRTAFPFISRTENHRDYGRIMAGLKSMLHDGDRAMFIRVVANWHHRMIDRVRAH
jgi:hypothetical protein